MDWVSIHTFWLQHCFRKNFKPFVIKFGLIIWTISYFIVIHSFKWQGKLKPMVHLKNFVLSESTGTILTSYHLWKDWVRYLNVVVFFSFISSMIIKIHSNSIIFLRFLKSLTLKRIEQQTVLEKLFKWTKSLYVVIRICGLRLIFNIKS